MCMCGSGSSILLAFVHTRAKLAWVREISFHALSLNFISPCWQLWYLSWTPPPLEEGNSKNLLPDSKYFRGSLDQTLSWETHIYNNTSLQLQKRRL